MFREKKDIISDINENTFSAKCHRQTNAIIVSMSGNADTIIYERLKMLLDELHAAARDHRVREMVFEVQDLYFINSSCLSLLLRLINQVIDLRDAEKYVVRFRSNANLRWQKKSLQAIASYARDVVVIE